MDNEFIRNYIYDYLKSNGSSKKSTVNSKLSEELGVSKNVISGNISWMICGSGEAVQHGDMITAI